jgi:subtilisin family serine protease
VLLRISTSYGLCPVLLTTILILSSVLGPVLSVSVGADAGGEGQSVRLLESSRRLGSNVEDLREGTLIANHSRVVLITGDVVHLYMLSDGTSRVAVEPSDPSRINRVFRIFEHEDGLYVIPSDAPLDKLDLELFNVRLLARQMQLTGLNDTLMVIARPVGTVSLEQFINAVLYVGEETSAEHRVKLIHRGLNLFSLAIDIRQAGKVRILTDSIIPSLEKVWLDRVYKVDLSQISPMLDFSVPQVGADWVWVNSQISGENVKIAVLDTGIDLTHRDFKYLNGTSKVIAAESFVDYPSEDNGNPEDYHGHGTHVSGIAAGTGLTEFVDPNTLSPIAHPLIKRPIVSSEWNDQAPLIAGNGTHLIVVWESDVLGNWDVWYTVYDGVAWTPPTQLTTHTDQDSWPYVTILPNNRILVAWHSNRVDGRWEIWYKVYLDGVWTGDKQLTTYPLDYDYAPAFTKLPDGTIGIIWSSEMTGSNTSNIYFAKLSLTDDGTLVWDADSVRQLTNAPPNSWLTTSSLMVTSSGRLYAFWYDASNFNFETNVGGITRIYYNLSLDGGSTWTGDTLVECSGCWSPYGIELTNGTLMVVFSGDDPVRKVLDTTFFMKLVEDSWVGPYWLPSDVWHRWRSSAAYGPGGLYVAFTSPGRPWEYYGNDIYITTPKPRYMGVAPKANLLEGKVLNRYGWGFNSWIISGIRWAVENRADIISMSLGGWPTDGNDPLSLAVDWAFDQGVLVVVAAGDLRGFFSITTPGAARKALTVGTINDSGTPLYGFGPTLDYRVKPEIVAPGIGICSSVPSYMFGVSYSCWSGSSMATPHVAGAAALAKQLARDYLRFDAPPEILKNALLVEATKDLEFGIYFQGAGRLDIKKLVTQSSLFGYGGVWIRPEVINFGPIAKGTEVSAEILIKEFNRERVLSLELEIEEVFTREFRSDVAQLNTTTIEIEPGEQKAVKLTIKPSAPMGLYSGKIRLIDNYMQTYTVVFGVAILNRLDIHKTPMEGPGNEWAVDGDIAYVFPPDISSGFQFYAGRRWGWFDGEGNARFFLPDGNYRIYTLGQYNYKPVFVTYDNLPLMDNTVITLDERDAHEVVFDPSKSGQVFAEVLHWIRDDGCSEYGGHDFIWLGYYPEEASVYYARSDVICYIDRYVYYPLKDVNLSDSRIISTSIWHDLLYVERHISSPITRVADYTQLVNKHTEYRTAATSRQLAERIIWPGRYPVYVYTTYSWLMNIPYSRIEIVSPDTLYHGSYKKWADTPSFSTPYWEYYGWFWTGGMSDLETIEVWGEQPLFPTIEYVNSIYWSGYAYIYLDAWTFYDSYKHYPWAHPRYPLDAIDVKIFRDGEEIPIDVVDYGDWGDYFIELAEQVPPAKYTLKVKAYEYQTLSTETRLEYDFFLNSDGSLYGAPVIMNIDVKDLTLNNTVQKLGIVTLFQLHSWADIQEVTFEYSVDGGATWQEAPVTQAGPEKYIASFPIHGQQYVSIRINATDTNNLKTSITTINGFMASGSTCFDFGRPTSPVEPGCVQVTEMTGYTSYFGYGWLAKHMLGSEVRGLESNRLEMDFVYGIGRGVFMVDVPNGNYRVTVIVGDKVYPQMPMEVVVEGTKLMLSTHFGEYSLVTADVSVSDGRLELEFYGYGAVWRVNAVIIEALP